MRIVKLRTSKPNTFWIMDNINLTPFQDTTLPFDIDEVYEEGQKCIYTAANVTGNIQIIDVPNPNNLMHIERDDKPIYELPGQQYQYAPRNIAVATADQTEIAGYDDDSDDSDYVENETPAINKDHEPGEEQLKEARKLLSRKSKVVEMYVNDLPDSKESRRFLLGCINTEKQKKKRKTVLDILEDKFLSIAPDVE